MSFTNLWSWVTSGRSRSGPSGTEKRPAVRFAPSLTPLEDRTVLNGFIAAGAGPGAPPLVAIRVDKVDSINGSGPNGAGQPSTPASDGKTDFTTQVFYAYNPGFRGGVHVATGNFDGNYNTPDWLVTGAGAGGGPHVIVWRTAEDPATGNIVVTGKATEFMAFDPRVTVGVNVACGDLNGDGKADLIVSAGRGGGPHVKVYEFGADGQFHLALQFFAFDPRFTGGVSIASGQGYLTQLEVRQLVQSLPANFQEIPYVPPTARPGFNTNPNLNIPLTGTTFDSTGMPRPYFTIAGGTIQYMGANLLNSFGNIEYQPDVLGDPLVTATWTATSANPPNFPFTPGTTYGPLVQLAPASNGSPAVVTRLTPGGGQVNARNQLILGAGPGGGPHVRILDIMDDSAGGLKINESVDFFAFDAHYTGGVNVSIGSFFDLPLPDLAGRTVTLNGRTFPVIMPSKTLPPLPRAADGSPLPLTFPLRREQAALFQAQILVTQMNGNQAVVWSDLNPGFLSGVPQSRTSITQLNLVPTLLEEKLVFDPSAGAALSGYHSLASTAFFDNAIDPQFRGQVFSTDAALRFDGTALNARGEALFAAGASNLPSRGARVRIFDQLGPDPRNGLLPNGFNNLFPNTPIDDFQAFTSGFFPGGVGGVAFGFGILPVPTRDIIQLQPIAVTNVSDPRLL